MTAAWRVGTLVEARPETATARRLVVDVADWPGNEAGQHLDVRLTAPDGYQATRSYSIASAGPASRIELAVDLVPDGEVSPYLVDDIAPGDQVEIHGPLGGYFVWRPGVSPRPVQLIAGGSGVVPLVAMARAHADAGDPTPFRLLYSVRTPDDVFFRPELEAAVAAGTLRLDLVHTRVAPPDAAPAGRLTRDRLAELAFPATEAPRVFVCGPTPFVEQVAVWLEELGHAAADIRTERFGGS